MSMWPRCAGELARLARDLRAARRTIRDGEGGTPEVTDRRKPAPKSGDGVSAWTTVFTLHDDAPDRGLVHVGAELTDGTYISGTLLSFDDDAPPTADRELVLVAPLELRTTDGENHPLGCQFTVLSARRIVRLDVTHLEKAA